MRVFVTVPRVGSDPPSFPNFMAVHHVTGLARSEASAAARALVGVHRVRLIRWSYSS